MSKDPARLRPSPCPICSKLAEQAHFPFCSAACRDRDLLAWLGEAYVMPGPIVGHDDEEG